MFFDLLATRKLQTTIDKVKDETFQELSKQLASEGTTVVKRLSIEDPPLTGWALAAQAYVKMVENRIALEVRQNRAAERNITRL